jgi:hypothetical protein
MRNDLFPPFIKPPVPELDQETIKLIMKFLTPCFSVEPTIPIPLIPNKG